MPMTGPNHVPFLTRLVSIDSPESQLPLHIDLPVENRPMFMQRHNISIEKLYKFEDDTE